LIGRNGANLIVGWCGRFLFFVVARQFSQDFGEWPENQILISDWTYFHCPNATLTSKKEMAAKLTQIAASGDQKSKIQQYRDLLSQLLGAKNQPDDLNAFVDHMVLEDTPLVISRQILQVFAQSLKELPPEVHKTVATHALAKLQPRVVAFEEQVSIIREHLAALYQDEEEWGEAAACLRAIPLDTGNR